VVEPDPIELKFTDDRPVDLDVLISMSRGVLMTAITEGYGI
jgi:hypothetical protein